MNVSVFDADGKYLRSIGKAGGRPAKGTYDPLGVYMPGGYTVENLRHVRDIPKTATSTP